VDLRLRVWQGLDRRPQVIDQCAAIAELLPLLDPGQSIPQCQQPLAAERSGVQLFEVTAISPSFTVAGASRDSVIPSLPMM
jgi:hypothetical protein